MSPFLVGRGCCAENPVSCGAFLLSIYWAIPLKRTIDLLPRTPPLSIIITHYKQLQVTGTQTYTCRHALTLILQSRWYRLGKKNNTRSRSLSISGSSTYLHSFSSPVNHFEVMINSHLTITRVALFAKTAHCRGIKC